MSTKVGNYFAGNSTWTQSWTWLVSLSLCIQNNKIKARWKLQITLQDFTYRYIPVQDHCYQETKWPWTPSSHKVSLSSRAASFLSRRLLTWEQQKKSVAGSHGLARAAQVWESTVCVRHRESVGFKEVRVFFRCCPVISWVSPSAGVTWLLLPLEETSLQRVFQTAEGQNLTCAAEILLLLLVSEVKLI